jgi:hypothetical protein
MPKHVRGGSDDAPDTTLGSIEATRNAEIAASSSLVIGSL